MPPPAQTLTIPTHLGLNLSAMYHSPSGPGPHPLVILCHGFTGNMTERHISSLAEDLAAAGISALRFDAPGSGDSQGTWAHDYRLTNYITSVPDVLQCALTHLSADPQRLGIWGHSMGGFVALASAARHPSDYAAVVCSQPSSGWKLLPAADEHAWRSTGWADFHNSHFPKISLPYAFYEDRQQYNALEEAPKLTVPALFIAGSKDEQVPAASVRRIYEPAPEPKTYLEFPASHAYKHDPENLGEINAATVEFFAKSLKLASS